jgi:hypothetical protein
MTDAYFRWHFIIHSSVVPDSLIILCLNLNMLDLMATQNEHHEQKKKKKTLLSSFESFYSFATSLQLTQLLPY